MATKYLPDEDHILRHVGFALLIRDPGDDRVIGCFPAAFELRGTENYLSASWLEYFPGNKRERIVSSIGACGKARTVKPSHGFAIGNVGSVKEACGSFGQKIRVIHEPAADNPNPAYTAVRRFKSDDLELLALLANEAWAEVIEVKDYLP
jgi:hypothetical protein